MLPELPPDTAPWVSVLVTVCTAVGLIYKWWYDTFKKQAEPKKDPLIEIAGGALADRTAMAGLQLAVERLAAAIERMIEEQERRDRERGHQAEIADLKRQIDFLRGQR